MVRDLLIRLDEVHKAGVDDWSYRVGEGDRSHDLGGVVAARLQWSYSTRPKRYRAFGNVGTQRPVHLRRVPTDVVEVQMRAQDEIDRRGIETRSGEPGHEVGLQVTPSGKRSSRPLPTQVSTTIRLPSDSTTKACTDIWTLPSAVDEVRSAPRRVAFEVHGRALRVEAARGGRQRDLMDLGNRDVTDSPNVPVPIATPSNLETSGKPRRSLHHGQATGRWPSSHARLRCRSVLAFAAG